MILNEYRKDGICDYTCINNNKNCRILCELLYNHFILKTNNIKNIKTDVIGDEIVIDLNNGRTMIFKNVPMKNGTISLLDLPDFDEEVK